MELKNINGSFCAAMFELEKHIKDGWSIVDGDSAPYLVSYGVSIWVKKDVVANKPGRKKADAEYNTSINQE